MLTKKPRRIIAQRFLAAPLALASMRNFERRDAQGERLLEGVARELRSADDKHVAGLQTGYLVVPAESGDGGVVSVGDAEKGFAWLDRVMPQPPVGTL